ncbi:MAG: Crp/Fnr family transcriptional regulator [Rhizobiaceae bacterium]|nr:Crp/Fnr family transcriptional regulator [Rhizobiaceae bacterium]
MKILELIRTNGVELALEKGDHVFRQGDEDKFIYFVTSGFLKAYYLSEDGKENIKSFIEAGGRIGSLRACYAGEKCSFSLLCMEDCKLLKIEFSKLYEASKTDPEIAFEMVEFLLGFSLKKEIREFEFLCLSAEQRYARMTEENPEFASKITQNEIARYLGVTPVGLSRIKKRLER